MKNKNTYKRGFTLIELLAVVFIIGILAAVALHFISAVIVSALLLLPSWEVFGRPSGGGTPPMEPCPYPDMVRSGPGEPCIPNCPYGWSDQGTCNPAPEESAEECVSLPDLSHFTVSSSTYTPTEITLTLTPKGNPGFEFVILVIFKDGSSQMGAYCTGDKSLCKAMGNGVVCRGENYTGADAWCFKE